MAISRYTPDIFYPWSQPRRNVRCSMLPRQPYRLGTQTSWRAGIVPALLSIEDVGILGRFR